MASLIEELVTIIEETTGCYKELLIVANNKKDVIIKGNVPGLQTLTDQEQGVAGRLLRLEKKRMEILGDICLVTNKDPKTITISKLIEMLSKQENEQKKLRQVSDELIKIVNEVKEINDLNKLLINESIDFVNFTMTAIKTSTEAPSGTSYERKGNLYQQQFGNNFFDAKQ